LRDVARYRIDLVGVRTADKQRVEKLLEDAQVKLSVVAADIFGVSGRAMLAALIAGERDPKVLAQLARGRLRAKRSVLEEAFTGSSPTITRSCWPSCWPGSMRWTPTSPSWTTSSTS
jgi:transposase